MPAARLPPGLYERLLSLALDGSATDEIHLAADDLPGHFGMAGAGPFGERARSFADDL